MHEMLQRRRYVRTKLVKAAKIFFGRCEAIDCVVVDLSVGGVGIKASNVAAIPDEFDLSFDSARTLRPCRIAWRSETAVGAAFI
jgi:c-di-GMP-binding flagellar brake protein YcgR